MNKLITKNVTGFKKLCNTYHYPAKNGISARLEPKKEDVRRKGYKINIKKNIVYESSCIWIVTIFVSFFF